MSQEDLEQLHVRSDGVAETPSGQFAVRMLTRSGVDEGQAFFHYRTSYSGTAHTVVWPVDNPFALFPAAVATSLVARGYAEPIGQDDVDAYNEAIRPKRRRRTKAEMEAEENATATEEDEY